MEGLNAWMESALASAQNGVDQASSYVGDAAQYMGLSPSPSNEAFYAPANYPSAASSYEMSKNFHFGNALGAAKVEKVSIMEPINQYFVSSTTEFSIEKHAGYIAYFAVAFAFFMFVIAMIMKRRAAKKNHAPPMPQGNRQFYYQDMPDISAFGYSFNGGNVSIPQKHSRLVALFKGIISMVYIKKILMFVLVKIIFPCMVKILTIIDRITKKWERVCCWWEGICRKVATFIEHHNKVKH